MEWMENRMKLSDYVAKKVAENNINHVFMVTGGGAMHLNHSFGLNKDIEVFLIIMSKVVLELMLIID